MLLLLNIIYPIMLIIIISLIIVLVLMRNTLAAAVCYSHQPAIRTSSFVIIIISGTIIVCSFDYMISILINSEVPLTTNSLTDSLYRAARAAKEREWKCFWMG